MILKNPFFWIFCFFAIAGAFMLSNLAHELSHYKDIKDEGIICAAEFGGDAYAYYTYHSDKPTSETRALTIGISVYIAFILIFLGMILWEVLK
jgi:hypothetical protein